MTSSPASFISRVGLALALIAASTGCEKKKSEAPAGDKPATTGASAGSAGSGAKQAIAEPDVTKGDPAAAKPIAAGSAAAPEEAKPVTPATQEAAPPTTTGGAGGADPVQVVEAIFAAAASGKADALAGLCAPDGSGDGDVKDLCGMTTASAGWAEFQQYFAKGKVDGAPRVDGDQAEVGILFGPDGTEDETMKLARIDGRWYLAGF